MYFSSSISYFGITIWDIIRTSSSNRNSKIMGLNKHDVINDLRSGCNCENKGYCPLEDIVNANANQRFLEQHKLVERFRGRKPNWKEIDWNKAYEMWSDEGWAKKFAEVYDEKHHYEELEKRMGIYV